MNIYINKKYPGEVFVSRHDVKHLHRAYIDDIKVIDLSDKRLQGKVIDADELVSVSNKIKIKETENDYTPKFWIEWVNAADASDNDLQYNEWIRLMVYAVISSIVFSIYNIYKFKSFSFIKSILVFIVVYAILFLIFIIGNIIKMHMKKN